MDQELNDIFSALDRVRVTDAADAFTMPGGFYTSRSLFDIERERLFRRQWICVGREEEIKIVGDYLAVDIVGEPIVLTRVSDTTIKALSNVCRHRGMPLVEGRGHRNRFTCPYHAWTYDLNGQLLHAQGVDDRHSGFLQACRLPEFPCERWHGFVFVCLDANANPLSTSNTIRAIEPMVSHMHLEEMRLIYSSDQEWDVNWKCLVENFMEGYHLSTVHRKTLHPYTPTRLSRHFEGGDNHFGYYSYYPDDLPPRGRAHPDMTSEEMKRSLMLAIAPSSVFAISGFKATYNLIQPVSPTRLRTRIGMIGIPPENDEDRRNADAAVDLFTRTFAEDKAMLVRLMRGMMSKHLSSSVLAKADYEGPIWDFYQYLAGNLSVTGDVECVAVPTVLSTDRGS